MSLMNIKTIQQLFIVVVFLILGSCQENQSKSIPQGLHSINIIINGHIPKRNMTKAVFSIIHKDSMLKLNGKIARRGGFSMSFPKHSYEIDLKTDISLAGLPADDDWILNANYIDKTFLRHVISYELFEDMNKNNIAPKCAYINLFINENYRGLYVLMEKLDKSSLKINSEDSLAFIFKEPHIFRKSYDKIRPQKKDNFHQQTFPKKQKKDRSAFIEHIRDFILTSNDDVFTKEISTKFDLTNLIDWHLLLLISNNGDGILKNFYLYKQDAKSPMRIAPWDYDHSFGRDGDNELNLDKNSLDITRSILFDRLLKFDWYKEQLKERWITLNQEGILSAQGLQRRILNKSRFIQKYAEANFEVWPVESTIYYDNNNFDQEIKIMLDFIKIRHARLRKYFLKYPM